MSPTPDSTLADAQQIIADLQRQLAERRAERDEGLAERDKAQRRLAERTAERDEALEQQTATAEVLQVINSSPGDLSPVFEAILEKAHSLCGAVHGSLMTFDGEFFRAGATHGLPDSMAEFLHGGFPIYPGSPQDRLVRGERFVHIPDRARI
jgi:two-component system NtrC family sensor kinase